jgi:hypothetical protein
MKEMLQTFLRTENVAGAGVFVLTFVVLGMLWAEPALADNDLFKTLAQAIVVQGLIGLAMASWFTKRPRSDEPQSVQIDQPANNPVPVEETRP